MTDLSEIKLVRCSQVLAPDVLGARDLVIAGERIVAVADPGVEITGLDIEVLDLRALTVAPGFIDNHVHVLGGGGGLGFASRAPELQSSQLTRAGITTVIGMLGFDATSKDMRALVAKTKAFKEDGISAYALTGATLEHPVPTLTGRIRDDIAFVEEIIGVGEISVSELGYAYDSNGPGAQYIAEAATPGLLAGRLARKRGYLCLQVPPYHGVQALFHAPGNITKLLDLLRTTPCACTCHCLSVPLGLQIGFRPGRATQMARQVNLSSRTARSRLTARKDPYYQTLKAGTAIGYYRPYRVAMAHGGGVPASTAAMRSKRWRPPTIASPPTARCSCPGGRHRIGCAPGQRGRPARSR